MCRWRLNHDPAEPAIDDSPHYQCDRANGHEGVHMHDVEADGGRTVTSVMWSALDEGAWLA